VHHFNVIVSVASITPLATPVPQFETSIRKHYFCARYWGKFGARASSECTHPSSTHLPDCHHSVRTSKNKGFKSFLLQANKLGIKFAE